ncbi:MAG: DUF1223 domain-containing protein [Rhodobacteraceae bacterium]|nr:DUF1223 domain-containing protein [Paracoccaceae bacterium]
MRNYVRFLTGLAAAGAAVSLGAGAARADDPVVVELFTSQGCSSCPPADRLLTELARRDDVIALSFHVDYWDYLGWEDTLASDESTQRQRTYAPRVNREYIGRKLRGSFTPEIVVEGTDSLVGSDREDVLARIEAHSAAVDVADVTVRRDGDALVVELTPVGNADMTANVRVAQFIPVAEVEIERGENAGRTIVYTNVVTALTDIGRWDGRQPHTIRVENVTGPAAVLVQRGEAGQILAAARAE